MTKLLFEGYVENAQRFLGIQRKKRLFFSNDAIFNDPAWELLLEIYIATEQEYCLSLSDLSERLSAPASITSRWVNVFEDQSYLATYEQKGVSCLRLTDSAKNKCVAYLEAVADADA